MLEDYESAAVAFKKGLEIQPGNSEIYTNLGNMYVRLDQYEEATNAFENDVFF